MDDLEHDEQWDPPTPGQGLYKSNLRVLDVSYNLHNTLLVYGPTFSEKTGRMERKKSMRGKSCK